MIPLHTCLIISMEAKMISKKFRTIYEENGKEYVFNKNVLCEYSKSIQARS